MKYLTRVYLITVLKNKNKNSKQWTNLRKAVNLNEMGIVENDG